MIKILDLYLARTLIGTTFMSLMVLVGLSSLLKFVEQLKFVGRGTYDMLIASVYILLSMPREIEMFFPMATLIGGLIGMGILASNSELVVMQAAGMSRANIIGSAMKTALLMVLFVMSLGEWVAPVTEAQAKELRTQAITGGSLFTGGNAVWAKDGDDFVSIGEVRSKTELANVRILHFGAEMALQSITTADSAIFSGSSWRLKNVEVTEFSEGYIDVAPSKETRWESQLTPDKLGVVAVKPEALSIRGLLDYVAYLHNNGQDAGRYELAFWRKVLQPVSVGIMLLLALSFVFGPLRSVTMGARVIMGVLTGFGFFIANEVFGPMSLVYQLPPLVGALLPSALFAGLAAYLVRK
ncbi:LPS export ABC transporter permease LptG [Bowmanella sp. JS7-9]|uniref:LPS export ABC transporter permease LptG n=1 Tax=Pseudobowmanella zhangzhouensis TaxID=1537679 RepID=A0ABW1XLM0_9ALTE|nr:LPS export ABC transporter permease LptG [Bowmanella sp. JS7-9]TBX21900.1 lipopolysaccharide ABC transporter permease [Bowmanella sp. JS7-9]